MRLLSLAFLMIFIGTALYGQQSNRSTAVWHTYINTEYGYKIRYPKDFELWPTGPEAFDLSCRKMVTGITHATSDSSR